MSTNLKTHSENPNSIFQKASEFLIDWIRLYHNIGQKTLLLLSGGSSVNIYKNLAEFIQGSDLDFGFLAFGQVDERFRPDQSWEFRIRSAELNQYINAELIRKTKLWEVCKKKRIPYDLISQEGTLENATEQYNEIIEKLFKEYIYKIAILGIGEDGHTAGLLPGYEKIWNKGSYVVGYDLGQNGPCGPFCQQFKERVSLTPKALSQLDQAVVVAVGEKKKSVLKKLTSENIKNESINKYPMKLIREIGNADLFTDITEI